MKIYADIELFNNRVEHFIANSMVIGNNNLAVDGAIKYDSSSHSLLYYSTEQVDGEDKGWTSIGGSGGGGSVNGVLRINKGSNASFVFGNSFDATVATSSGNSTRLTFDLDTDGFKVGNLIISNNGDSSNRVSIDLLNGLYQQYMSEIMKRTIKFGSFNINSNYTNPPIIIRISHNLETRHLGLFLYKSVNIDGSIVYQNILPSRYYIETSGNNDVVITLDGTIENIRGTYGFVLFGSKDNAEINTITITQN